MIKIKLLFPLLFVAFSLSAQLESDSIKRVKEREIKTSGLYLYGEATGKNKDDAAKMAKKVLVEEINKEIQNNPEWRFAKTIEAKNVEYDAACIDLPRGNNIRVIAYIQKDNLQAVFAAGKKPDIKLTDKKEDKGGNSSVMLSVMDTVPEQQSVIQPENTEQMFVETSNTVDEIPIAKDSLISVTEGSLLQQIVNAGDARQLNKLLHDNKIKGKTVYGKMETLTSASDAYIVVYKKNGELVAILDKGTDTKRKDLISGEMKTEAVYQGNQLIWFQLF